MIHQAGKAGITGMQQEVTPNQNAMPLVHEGGLLKCILPGVALAAAASVGIVAVDGLIAFYTGSYLPLKVFLMVSCFWAAVSAAGTIVLGVLLIPLFIFMRGPVRTAILPALVTALAFFIHLLIIRQVIIGADAIGRDILLHTVFAAFWAVLLGCVAAVLSLRLREGAWGVWFLAVTGPLFAAGLACFVRPASSAYSLVVGPLALLAIGGSLIAALPSGRMRAMAGGLSAPLFAAILMVVAGARGERPLAPIEREIPAQGSAQGKPNLILIVVDTLRADHTTICGYGYPTTPNLEKLASDSMLYTHGVSVDSCTLPSHASILTGKYPREHGARELTRPGVDTIEKYRPCFNPLVPSQVSLATYLAQAGYRTGGFAGNYARLCRHLGIDQGFSYYHDMPRLLLFTAGGSPAYKYGLDAVDRILARNGKLLHPYWDAGTLTRLATAWIDKGQDAPFFLFINYMDPHYPYSAIPPFTEIDGPSITYDMRLRQRPWQDIISRFIRTGDGFPPELRKTAINQYDGEIALVDDNIGLLIGHLKALGLYDSTLIIVTSDHGEFFGEHRMLDHSLEIYEEGVRVPILLKYPRRAHAGERSAARVSTVDIFATVLDVAGLPRPAVTAQPFDRTTHEVIIENYENGLRVQRYGKSAKRDLTAVYSGDLKYIKSTSGEHRLYNLALDPLEANNLISSDPAAAERMGAMADAWLAKTPYFDATPEAKQYFKYSTGAVISGEFQP